MVWIPATSEPAPGSVMPRQAIFSPFIAGTRYCSFCSWVPRSFSGGLAMSVWTATPMTRPPECDRDISSASTICVA
ncbi:unannotated protein [freshwater metagenome]|uniref:Unannotated protein n=1 Tax=freshwater metagenome TaxID=449393 RepID=A0A6J7JH50_9ZZZZ